MAYEIVRADETSVTVWDMTSVDPDHPREIAGLMTLVIGPHNFAKGEIVALGIVRIYNP